MKIAPPESLKLRSNCGLICCCFYPHKPVTVCHSGSQQGVNRSLCNEIFMLVLNDSLLFDTICLSKGGKMVYLVHKLLHLLHGTVGLKWQGQYLFHLIIFLFLIRKHQCALFKEIKTQIGAAVANHPY